MSTTTTTNLLAVLAIVLLLATVRLVELRRGGVRAERHAPADGGPLVPVLLLIGGPLAPADGGPLVPTEARESYPTYACSPPVTGAGGRTRAIMTLNDFDEGGDGGYPSQCDEKYHRNTERVVALSTGWYSGGARCNRKVRVYANGRSVLAEVVDQCDSMNGCDEEHVYQPPCRYNVVDASQAVWDALGITGEEVGEYNITWSDA